MGAGRIILILGASSAGKTTLARAVQARAPVPFWRYSFDTLRDGEVLPFGHPAFDWTGHRARVFDGLHASIAAFAGAGNDLIVEHILDTPGWTDDLRRLLTGRDLFTVVLHLPLANLRARAAARGDRPDLAEADFALMQDPPPHDLALDGRNPPEANADRLLTAWAARGPRSAFLT